MMCLPHPCYLVYWNLISYYSSLDFVLLMRFILLFSSNTYTRYAEFRAFAFLLREPEFEGIFRVSGVKGQPPKIRRISLKHAALAALRGEKDRGNVKQLMRFYDVPHPVLYTH